MEQLIEAISRILPSLSPQMRRAANHILDNPGAIAVNSMRAMAGVAKVSPPTMLRFAQRLGYENYDTFRDVFKNEFSGMGYGDRADDLRKSMDISGIPGIIRNTAAAALTGIERFNDPVFLFGVEQIADMVITAPKTFIVAGGASFGQAISFHYVCKMALPNLELAAGLGMGNIDCLISLKKNDAIIIITTFPNAHKTVEAMMFAKNRGAKVIAITDRRSSFVGEMADAALIIDTYSPHYFPSLVSLSASLEALCGAIAAKRGVAAVASISEYEKAFNETTYYWDENQ
jgi:DNA-binding MurR/RpiR family transcriptional regulator